MEWTLGKKIGFRFLFCYLLLFTFSNQFFPTFIFDPIWQKFVPWFAEHILGLPEKITIFTNGSGDTTYNYVSLLVYVALAAIATLIWSIFDRLRPNYNVLLKWFLVLIRYYLVYQMVIYGLAKLFYMQFQPERFSRLVQAYGDSSPMGLLWTFMGHSKGYTMFTGFGELLGGLLLIPRKTRTIGALVVFGVMANVMALNYFYDVPVKILSTHLVLMSIFLLVLDGERLWKVFITNQSTEPRIIPPYFQSPKLERAKNVVKWLLLTVSISYLTYNTLSLMKQWGPNANKAILYGLYEVETFEKNGKVLPPLTTDSIRWKHLIMERKGFAEVRTMTNKRLRYEIKPDTNQNIIIYNLSRDTVNVDTFHFSRPDSLHFHLEGIRFNDTLKIVMKRKKKEDFLLRSREFRWINEYPFNR